MTAGFNLKVPMNALTWWSDSPEAGDPHCLCSYCGLPIGEREFPIRLYWRLSDTDVREARFHDACCEPVLGMKVQSFDDDDIAWPDDIDEV